MKRINLQKAKAQIARPNMIRDINRQIVLNYVRERWPISRAEIARETALHRSTVSVITDDLVDAGLIVTTGEGRSSGGRRPTLYALKTGEPVAIGVDVTPRTTTIAITDLAGSVMEMESFATSPDPEFMIQQIVERVCRMSPKNGKAPLDIGISVPGLVDQASGQIFHVPYFDWRDWDICARLREATGSEVIVENDANATALAELWFGQERISKSDTFVMVLVGEGIGTGVIFDGQVFRGEMGAGGEFGHMIAGTDSPIECSCGSRECWEGYSSEKSMIKRYQLLLEKDDIKGGAIDISNLLELAANGERHALAALRETAKYLANGISNLVVGLSPQVVVVSGRITRAWDLISRELSRISVRSEMAGLPSARIVPSSLGDAPTLIGATGLVLARKFGSAS